MLETAPNRQAATWLDSFARALEAGDIDGVVGHFLEDCYWRDLLAFTWNIRTMEGRPAIRDMLRETLARTGPAGWRLAGDATTDGGMTEAWFTFSAARPPWSPAHPAKKSTAIHTAA